VGGFELAASRHGIKPVWASEIEPFCIAVTKKHFPEMEHVGDICKLNGANLQPVDIITGGSPCQDLSKAGKQAGLAGARSGLFLEMMRVVKEMRRATDGRYPRYVVWENVTGAFSSNEGKDFKAVIEAFTGRQVPIPRVVAGKLKWEHAGMVNGNTGSFAWRVFNARYWGVPQQRQRIFAICDFRGKRAGEILFKPEGVCGDSEAGGAQGQGHAGPAGEGADATGFRQLDFGKFADDCAPTLAARDYKGGYRCMVVEPIVLDRITLCDDHAGDRRGLKIQEDGVTPPLMAQQPHAVAYKLNGISNYAEGVGTLRAKGGDCAGGSETLIVESYCEFDNCEDCPCYDECDKDHNNYAERPKPVCIQGNLVRMAGNNAQNGCGHKIDESFTLNTQDIHAVAVTENQRAEVRLSDYTFPVATGGGKPGQGYPAVLVQEEQQYAVRKLTPLECERLQGFPDYWTDIIDSKDTPRYIALGNSIAIPCAEYIMKGIAAVYDSP
jgi:DNA (cytosine-5)-methyltransferase 1